MEREVTVISLAIEGRELQISYPERLVYPKDRLTKLDVATYYRDVAEVMVPHLAGRPLTLQRFPEGIGEEGFFQKEAPEHFPPWIERARIPKENGEVAHATADSESSLVYLANQGTVTFHTALSHGTAPDKPDRIIFDLDPSEDHAVRLRTAVRAVRNLGRELGMVPFLMTTGSRGFHVLFPIERGPDFDDARTFTHDFAALLASRNPDELTIAHRKADRGHRVFIDYLRNGYAQTAVAPYSLRALPGAPVAAPVDWVEYGRGTIGPQTYTIANVRRRLAQKHDPWRDVDKHAAPLDAVARRLAARQRSDR